LYHVFLSSVAEHPSQFVGHINRLGDKYESKQKGGEDVRLYAQRRLVKRRRPQPSEKFKAMLPTVIRIYTLDMAKALLIWLES
jgi:hypothetical protein